VTRPRPARSPRRHGAAPGESDRRRFPTAPARWRAPICRRRSGARSRSPPHRKCAGAKWSGWAAGLLQPWPPRQCRARYRQPASRDCSGARLGLRRAPSAGGAGVARSWHARPLPARACGSQPRRRSMRRSRYPQPRPCRHQTKTSCRRRPASRRSIRQQQSQRSAGRRNERTGTADCTCTACRYLTVCAAAGGAGSTGRCLE
jgi:hypothetical protein